MINGIFESKWWKRLVIIAMRLGFTAGMITGSRADEFAAMATALDGSMQIEAPHGHQVLDHPGGKVVKTVQEAGRLAVAARLRIEGIDYYISEWSWDRYAQGHDPNWMRLLPRPEWARPPQASETLDGGLRSPDHWTFHAARCLTHEAAAFLARSLRDSPQSNPAGVALTFLLVANPIPVPISESDSMGLQTIEPVISWSEDGLPEIDGAGKRYLVLDGDEARHWRGEPQFSFACESLMDGLGRRGRGLNIDLFCSWGPSIEDHWEVREGPVALSSPTLGRAVEIIPNTRRVVSAVVFEGTGFVDYYRFVEWELGAPMKASNAFGTDLLPPVSVEEPGGVLRSGPWEFIYETKEREEDGSVVSWNQVTVRRDGVKIHQEGRPEQGYFRSVVSFLVMEDRQEIAFLYPRQLKVRSLVEDSSWTMDLAMDVHTDNLLIGYAPHHEKLILGRASEGSDVEGSVGIDILDLRLRSLRTLENRSYDPYIKRSRDGEWLMTVPYTGEEQSWLNVSLVDTSTGGGMLRFEGLPPSVDPGAPSADRLLDQLEAFSDAPPWMAEVAEAWVGLRVSPMGDLEKVLTPAADLRKAVAKMRAYQVPGAYQELAQWLLKHRLGNVGTAGLFD